MISVVVPILDEQLTVRELCRRTAACLDRIGDTWELILVNDGSGDECSALLREIHREDPRIKVIELSRNFGHQQALTAGIARATGDCVVVMDGDLQDPPEAIADLVAKWKQGYQVVFAERSSRSETGVRSLGQRIFYPIMRLVTELPTVQEAGVFGLMDRVVVDEFDRLEERNRFIPGLRTWLGFRQGAVPYDRADRAKGKPKQSFSRLVTYALDGMVSFSYKPLRAATYFGFFVSLVALGLGVFYFVTFFTEHKPITGFTTTIVCVLFIGGVQMICVGVLGEYIGRIYEEVKRRPLYIVKGALGLESTPPKH